MHKQFATGYPDTYMHDAIKDFNIYLEYEHCRRQHRGKPVAEVEPLLPASCKQFAAGYRDTYVEFNIYLECGYCRRQHRGKTVAEVAPLLRKTHMINSCEMEVVLLSMVPAAEA